MRYCEECGDPIVFNEHDEGDLCGRCLMEREIDRAEYELNAQYVRDNMPERHFYEDPQWEGDL